jgi:hypothetical protein
MVAVGRGAVVAVTVDGTAVALDVELTTEVVEETGGLLEALGLPVAVLVPHAVAQTTTARMTMLRWREAGRGAPVQRKAIVSEMMLMGDTIDLRGGVPHRTHPLRSASAMSR